MATETKTSTEHDAKLPLCKGCRDDFYNRGNGCCWSLPTAQVVTLYRIGWWTQPTSPNAYSKVVTLSCHHAPGQYAQHKEPAECFPRASEIRNSEAYDARSTP